MKSLEQCTSAPTSTRTGSVNQSPRTPNGNPTEANINPIERFFSFVNRLFFRMGFDRPSEGPRGSVPQ